MNSIGPTRSIFRLSARQLFLLLLLWSAAYTAAAQTAKKVLFIGNSFIGTNDLPALVKNFAHQAGLTLSYRAHTPGGIYVKYLPQGSAAHANNPYVYDLIRSDNWDYVVVQDNQGFFCSPTPGYFGKDSYVAEGHMQLRDSLLKKNPCAKIILFSGWLDKDPYGAYPSLGLPDATAAHQRIYEQYQYLNEHFVRQIIAPIGLVWSRVLAGTPTVNLFAADNYHPSYEGSYVTAATLFSVIFHRSAEDVLFDGGLNPDTARFIRKAAFEVVRDSLESTGMSVDTPPLYLSGTSVSTDATYTAYQWYENDVAVPGATTFTLPFVAGNCYQVAVTDSKGCKSWSLKTCNPTAGTLIPGIYKTITPALYPNPVKGLLHINMKGRYLRITDVAGKPRYSTAPVPEYVDISAYTPGSYLVYITDESGLTRVQKIIKE